MLVLEMGVKMATLDLLGFCFSYKFRSESKGDWVTVTVNHHPAEPSVSPMFLWCPHPLGLSFHLACSSPPLLIIHAHTSSFTMLKLQSQQQGLPGPPAWLEHPYGSMDLQGQAARASNSVALSNQMVSRINKSGAWNDGLAVKSTCCSSGGPECGSQHPHHVTQPPETPSSGFHGHQHTQAHSKTHK